MREYFSKRRLFFFWGGGRCQSGIRFNKLCDTSRFLKNATGVNTSKFAKKFDLANLKSEIDKLDIG